MNVDGLPYRTIWRTADRRAIEVIDQTALPHVFRTLVLADAEQTRAAITEMIVRGAPLIGVTGAYGLALAAQADASDTEVERAAAWLALARPTAINLRWAIERARAAILAAATADRVRPHGRRRTPSPKRTSPPARLLDGTDWRSSKRPPSVAGGSTS